MQRLIFSPPASISGLKAIRNGGKRIINDVSLSKLIKNASVNSFLIILCCFYKHFIQKSSGIDVQLSVGRPSLYACFGIVLIKCGT
jgi:hypothetical protein